MSILPSLQPIGECFDRGRDVRTHFAESAGFPLLQAGREAIAVGAESAHEAGLAMEASGPKNPVRMSLPLRRISLANCLQVSDSINPVEPDTRGILMMILGDTWC